MTNSELKLDLIQKIINSNDANLLIKLNKLLNVSIGKPFEVNEPTTAYEKPEKVRVFSDWQQAKIDNATRQYENGECISDEEAQKEIQAWLED